MLLTIDVCVKETTSSGDDDVTTAQLCHIIHKVHIASWYRSLLLQVSVKDDDTSFKTATPELLLDDAYIVRH